MTQALIQILAAIVGSLGYSLIFNIKKDKLLYALAGSALGWAVYLFCFHFSQSLFLSNMLAAVFCTALAEFYARWRKAPATLFLLVHIIPLVPGGSLFYTMRSFILKDHDAFTSYGLNTLYVAAGIAVGILVVTSFISILNTSQQDAQKLP